MFRFASRAARARHVLTLIAVTTLGACADDQPLTAPREIASEPRVTATTLETTDGAVVTIVPDRDGQVRTYSGYVVVGATLTCSTSGPTFKFLAYVDQFQRKAQNTVSGFGEAYITCTGGAQPWQLLITRNAGEEAAFTRGKADVLFRVISNDVSAEDLPRTVRLVEVAGY